MNFQGTKILRVVHFSNVSSPKLLQAEYNTYDKRQLLRCMCILPQDGFTILKSKRKVLLIANKTFSTFYKTLQISPEATHQEIKKAYYEKSKKVHPDKCQGAVDEFVAAKTAYEVLGNKQQRIEYDEYLASLEKTNFTFTEWKLNRRRYTTISKDRYKSDQNSDRQQGIDMRWQDFTFFDYFKIVFLIGMFTFVVYAEKQMAHMRAFRKNKREKKNSSKKYHKVKEKSTKITENPPSLNKENIFEEINRTGTVSEEAMNVVVESFAKQNNKGTMKNPKPKIDAW